MFFIYYVWNGLVSTIATYPKTQTQNTNMMKKKIQLLLLFSACAMSAQSGKVGINTDNPEEKLHVNGSMKAKDIILDLNGSASQIPELSPGENYSFLLKSTSANRITTYNVQSSGGSPTNTFPAPFGIIQYNITTDNADKDWVNAYNTKINASKYVVILNSFNFNLPVVLGASDQVSRRLGPVAQVYTYEQDGTWWIKADYNGYAPPNGGSVSGLWNISLMIFDKTFARNIPVTVDLGGAATGVASSPLITN